MDIQLHHEEYGEGEPLILLHGNGESGEYFANQIGYFSQKRRVIALDTRGHGKSPRGIKTFSIEQFAEDLHDFMNEMQIKRSDILGFSDGGNIALTFALKYPKQVKRLILNGANLYPYGVKPTVQIPIVIGYKIAVHFAKKSSDAARNAEMLGLMVNEPNISPKQLKNLSMKTLVITGKHDMIKDSHTALIAANIPNAKWVKIDGDHFIANKNPKSFNAEVEKFLNE